jgi:flagellar basal body-associated protein FliL
MYIVDDIKINPSTIPISHPKDAKPPRVGLVDAKSGNHIALNAQKIRFVTIAITSMVHDRNLFPALRETCAHISTTKGKIMLTDKITNVIIAPAP